MNITKKQLIKLQEAGAVNKTGDWSTRVEDELMHLLEGRIIREYEVRGSGRYTQTVTRTPYTYLADVISILKLNVAYGNDAPRGGMLGNTTTIKRKGIVLTLPKVK